MAIAQHDVEFDRRGAIFDAGQLSAVAAAVPACTDVIVASHGWNNDMADARGLYGDLFGRLADVLEADLVPGLTARRLVALRVFWPSKRFTDEELIPGGGAAAAAPANDATLGALLEALENDPDRLGHVTKDAVRTAAVARVRALVPQLETDAAARREFVLQLRAILDPREAHEDDGSREFFTTDPEEIFRSLAEPVSAPLPAPTGGAAVAHGANVGGAASLQDLLSGTRAAARRLLNFTTYYEMKERAGTVGRVGGSQLLRAIRSAAPAARLHLVGHSFGARLVTAAAHELAPQTSGVTLTLLQAAFSHNGLASKFDGTHDGAFRRIVSEARVSGPILITHTKNDRAVGVAYPLASRLARQKAAALGDENDPYGGLGRNGAQHTPEVETGELLGAGKPYSFTPGAIYNLRADRFIADHGDIASHAVAYALLSSIGAS
jgi:hypothetical protein